MTTVLMMTIDDKTESELQAIIDLVKPGGTLDAVDFNDGRALRQAGLDIVYFLAFGDDHMRRQAVGEMPDRIRHALQALLDQLDSLGNVFTLDDVGVSFRTTVDDGHREELRNFVREHWEPNISPGRLVWADR